jgi:hypothetical protein
MAGRRDKVKESMNTVIPEARVTLNARFLSQNVIVLALEISNNFLEPMYQKYVSYPGDYYQGKNDIRKFVVDVFAESRCVNNGQGNTDAILLQVYRK